jgi:hypothetical protein
MSMELWAVDRHYELYVGFPVNGVLVTLRTGRLKRVRQVVNPARVRSRPRQRERLATMRTQKSRTSEAERAHGAFAPSAPSGPAALV